MRILIAVTLILVGIIHLLPLAGLAGSARLSALYGIAVTDPNLDLLLRHRAVLFGLLGAFCIAAAFMPQLQAAAFVAAFVSAGSFLLLAWQIGGVNAQVFKVVIADIVAVALLIVGAAALLWRKRGI
ncbi:MAG: phosphopantetheine adenylyltransferase [Burkholderiaceae bacterium]